jgi:hypothetical protein
MVTGWFMIKKIKDFLVFFHHHIIDHREHYLIKCIAFFFFVGHLSFHKLWVTSRATPLAPLWEGMTVWSYPWDYIHLVVHLFLLLIMIVRPPHIGVMISVFVSYLFLVVQDQNRFISWGLQYTGLLVLMIFWMNDKNKKNHAQVYMVCARIIIIAVYFWGGMNKINYRYFHHVFPWFARPLVGGEWLGSLFYINQETPTLLLKLFGAGSICMEIFISFGLAIKRTRNISIITIGILHSVIIYCLWSLDWAYSVMSWNVSMFFYAYIIFAQKFPKTVLTVKNSDDHHPLLFKWKEWSYLKIIAPVVGIYLILPLANLFDRWPTHLSFCMYSGSTKSTKFYIHKDMVPLLEPGFRPYLTHVPSSHYYFYDYFNMSYEETGYSGIPEAYIYRRNKRTLCNKFNQNRKGRGVASEEKKLSIKYPLLLMIEWRPSILTGEKRYTLEDCEGHIIKSSL